METGSRGGGAGMDYQAVFEALPGLFVVLEPLEFRAVAVSDAYLEQTGIRREDLVGHPIHQVFPDDPGNPGATGTGNLLASLRRVKEQRARDVMALQQHPIPNPRTGKFEERYWSPVNVPVLARDGSLRYIIHRSEDVTCYIQQGQGREAAPTRMEETSHEEVEVVRRSQELKQLSEQLRKSEALARMGGRVARLGGWTVTHAPRHEVYWSQEVFDILEYHGADVPLLADVLALCRPGYREQLQRALQRCAEEGGDFDLELELRTFRGNARWVRIAGRPESEGTQGVVRTTGAIQDITQKKLEQQERQHLSIRLFSTLETMSDAFYMVDRQWRLLYLNSMAEGLLGINRENVLGQVLWDAFPSIRNTPLYQGYYAAMSSGQPFHAEYYSKQLENWIKVDAYPSQDGLATYFHSTTEQHRLEERLHQAQRLEATGQLTGGVAHDFNNLLTVIIGNAELLLEQLDRNSPLYGLTGMISSAAQRGADLTQRLLAFARRQTLEPRVISINQLVRDMENLLLRTLGSDVTLGIDLEQALWPTLIDPHQLESALLNLSLNARDAMPDGGTLNIETYNLVLDRPYGQAHGDINAGSYAVLSVSDSGTGIAAEVRDQVFEPFFTTKAKGTGLGLSTVFGFIKQSNGHISLYSEAGEGTTIRIYLPRAEGDPAAQQPPEQSRDKEKITGGGEAILLVEDDALVREFALDQLASLGYRVTACDHAEAALARLKENAQYDLLFTDLSMPGMNGSQLAARARRLRPDLRILYTSGYAENALRAQRSLEAAAPLLIKPYQRSALAAKIRQALEKEAAHG